MATRIIRPEEFQREVIKAIAEYGDKVLETSEAEVTPHPPTYLGAAPWAPPPAGPRAAGAGSRLRWQVRGGWGALGEDGPPVQTLERKRGKAGAGHLSLTWPPASVVHACRRSELSGALLRGLGFAGCGES